MITRRNLLALPGAVALTGALQACGGGGSTKAGNVRLLNATNNTSIDLRIANANIITAVTKDAVSGYVEVAEGTTAFQIGVNGSTSTVLTQSDSVSNNTSYTIVAYATSSTTLNAAYFADSEGAPTSGTAKLRLFNASIEAGSLDVYVVTPGVKATGATALNAAVTSQRVGAYTQVSAGTWDIVVTGAGDTSDVRLTLSSVALADQQILTLVATATGGGLLVNGVLLNQAGTATAYATSTVRLRVVANLTSNAPFDVQLNGAALAGFTGVNSPTVGAYLSVPSDLRTLTVNGVTPTADTSLQRTPGTDLTLLVYGTAAAPIVKLVEDNNSLPSSTSKSNMRVAHLVNGLAETITLTADFATVGSAALGAVSSPVPVTTTSTMNLAVSAPSNASLWPNPATTVALTSPSVYTLFMLGDSASPRGILRKDR